MSALDPVPSTDASTESASLLRARVAVGCAQRWRTQRLFDLAVTASESDPRRIARAMGIDFRSLSEMREVPNLLYIARIARVLGIDTASAADVIGLGNEGALARAGSMDALVEQMADADLDDDAATLDRLASAMSSAARGPSDLALSIVCSARADAARGEVLDALERTRFSAKIGFGDVSSPASALAAEMCAVIESEARLGEPWAAHDSSLYDLDTRDAASARHARHLSIAPAGARGFRQRAFLLAHDLICAASRDGCTPGDAITALRGQVASAADSGCARSLAWSASIAGVAALRALECARLPTRTQRSAMELLVGAQLAIDERIARNAFCPSMALLRRRLRISLFEWCDRARRGEIVEALMDDFDDSEVRTMFVRFPRARRPSMASSADRQSHKNTFDSQC